VEEEDDDPLQQLPYFSSLNFSFSNFQPPLTKDKLQEFDYPILNIILKNSSSSIQSIVGFLSPRNIFSFACERERVMYFYVSYFGFILRGVGVSASSFSTFLHL